MEKVSQNKEPRRISVSEMAPHVHNFQYNENKVEKILGWLKVWIDKSIQSGKIKPYDFLPLKGDLAFHIGVSLGTMQNVFRLLEDSGYIESKQRIGSYISDKNRDNKTEKLTSKREIACEKIKKYIKWRKYKVGDALDSIRKIGHETGMSSSTIRIAINTLISSGIISKNGKIFTVCSLNLKEKNLTNLTLAQKIACKIERKISTGITKLPSNIALAEEFKVSVKTIHDALKILSKKGLVLTKRGQYGTVIVQPNSTRELYLYEESERKIEHYITANCKIGDKLPPIQEFSNMYNVSVKTIKKALDNLESEGCVRFMRGRYGGTFVTDIPDSTENYTWIALNPDYIQ